jgi:hypothetical protein
MSEATKNQGQWRRYALFALAGVCLLGTVFGAGFFAGRWSIRTRSVSPAASAQRAILSGGHGAIGKITQIEDTRLLLETRDGTTRTILTDNQTRVERGVTRMTRLAFRDLKIGDQIIVIGTPNKQGHIKAKVIRVFPIPTLTPTPTGL